MDFLRDVRSGAISTESGDPRKAEHELFLLLQKAGSLEINPTVSRVSRWHFKADPSWGLGWAGWLFKPLVPSQVPSEEDSVRDVLLFFLFVVLGRRC